MSDECEFCGFRIDAGEKVYVRRGEDYQVPAHKECAILAGEIEDDEDD